MRFTRFLVSGFAALAFWSGAARADNLAMSDNPYSTIAGRNTFALVPIPVKNPDLQPVVPVDPPPKITVNGTTTILGKVQVLCTVVFSPLPGQPPDKKSFLLTEGETVKDIEVTKIDMTRRMVSFINHGVAEDISLAEPKN